MLLPRIFDDAFMGNEFDEMFQSPFFTNGWKGMDQMKSDIKELEQAYEVAVELPGFKKEDVSAELKDGYLNIRAVHSDEKEEKDQEGKYIRRERYRGTCQRSYYVGDKVTQEDIKAKFNDGILTVTVPKMEQIEQKEEKNYIAIEG